MLGGRVNDQTDNKNCLHIYTKLQEWNLSLFYQATILKISKFGSTFELCHISPKGSIK